MKIVMLTAVVLLIACGGETREPAPVQAQTDEVRAPEASAGAVQEHTINIAGDFSPSTISLAANQPARLNFRRGSEPTCGDEIVFPDLDIRKKVAANETVSIDIPAQQARTLSFTCGMNMMKGSIVIQ